MELQALGRAPHWALTIFWVSTWATTSSSTKELMLSNCGYWRRLLRVPWTARRSNQSILNLGSSLWLIPFCQEHCLTGTNS